MKGVEVVSACLSGDACEVRTSRRDAVWNGWADVVSAAAVISGTGGEARFADRGFGGTVKVVAAFRFVVCSSIPERVAAQPVLVAQSTVFLPGTRARAAAPSSSSGVVGVESV
jgi:hypothetical protein